MKHQRITAVSIVALALLLNACQSNDDDTDATMDTSGGNTSTDGPTPSNGTSPPEGVGSIEDPIQSEGVANPLVDSSSLDTRINGFLSENPVAGMSVAIVRADAKPVVWTGNYGVRNIETGVPVNNETSFWLGSVSKMVMGTAMMIAREKGFLDLDDNVQALLAANGSFSIDNPLQKPIKLVHLASHTSGIVDAETYLCAYYVAGSDGEPLNDIPGPDGEPLIDVSCPDQTPVSLEGYLGNYLDKTGLLYDIDENFSSSSPGDAFEYSNIGAGLAGHVIGLATGQDLATFASQEIFTPLNMLHTSWRSADLDQDNIATPYIEIDEEMFALPNYELATWPDGALRSNAADLAALLAELMQALDANGAETNLLRKDSIEAMLPVGEAEHGLFVEGDIELEYAGEVRRIVGHTGSDPGAFSIMLFDPETSIGVVVTGNGDDSEYDEDAYVQLVLALFESGTALQPVTP